jgi:hypothetical protein
MNRITASQYFYTKLILWVLGIILIPVFAWYIPTRTYKIDKQTIEVTNSASGDIVEFDGTNSWGYKIHVKFQPNNEKSCGCGDGDAYDLHINGEEWGTVSRKKEWYATKDTQGFIFVRPLYTVISFLLICLQCLLISYFIGIIVEDSCLDFYFKEHFRCDSNTNTIELYDVTIIGRGSYFSSDFLFSKVFGLFPTAKRVNRLNKFLGLI